ncbi:Formamidopyrimidine-DNA glycosylase N-terminal domain-containing protein [Neurospora intermedia]|uniref:Formamidopyrimidine-DNA glycosylase N-terminal domain-containing protein n=1 Tax=Neurospora intermedia TaxID=5142 RepID=A0ABR3D4Z0_NEUIN
MPEIAEIARAVHFLRLHFVGKVIKHAEAIDDGNVFGKVGTDGPKMATDLIGKKIVSAGTQGKYFWMELSKAPHLVMHFGMTGWIHIKGERTAYTNYYKKMKPDELDKWPPKYWKFKIETEDGDEMAFTDPRRFGRVRVVDCPGEDIRKYSPLVENGPDPVVDLDVFTEDYLREKMKSRRVPIKALLLDQAVISGIGNWVADEVLYHAKLHPEQYCNDFSDAEMKQLYESIRYVCQTAVDKLGDSDQFPDDWLFNYRWGKGSKNAHSHTPNGDKLAFLTVGGRTSCYAPARQKKTGQIVSSVKKEPLESAEEKDSPKKAPGTKGAKSDNKSEELEADGSEVKPERATSRKRKIKIEEDGEVTFTTNNAKAHPSKKPTRSQYFVDAKKPKRDAGQTEETKVDISGRRRSGRLQSKAA